MSEYVENYELERPSAAEIETLACDENVIKTITKLQAFQSQLHASKFITECHQSLHPIKPKVSRIRCLALGSPVGSKNALYQLAFLAELASFLGINEVSVYDPVFTKTDIYLLENHLKYSVTKGGFGKVQDLETLYFMPHAPLELTQVLLDSEKPLYFLGNDILAHTDRYTKAKLHDKYETISLLVHLSEDKPKEKSADDFTPVSRRKKKKNVFVEPEINYDYTNSYLGKLQMTRYKESFKKDSDWGNSFSDLALHVIEPRLESNRKDDVDADKKDEETKKSTPEL
ncbi:uncharacterized protein CANTADRAFT_24464 [Suhomyces tanzawaensis NRRL Y-17324]|uniref:SRR1-like domain-containing protein n=1 Tax=Suhomyces tanzawaensis NRRL Y-17324 TaxID=984487 RepID=A0A1E4SQ75_9ASCO|nr:uncharacterized protein CANTADRAFT_24464 [Suhomyces tanzawaensis NRRL Y-17324]ODV81562.1 hypothetical protein CANTADRAFT_24464 [Suhomyces tanzawaensis NRRL Y-17324]